MLLTAPPLMSAGGGDSALATRSNALVIHSLIAGATRRVIDETGLKSGTPLLLRIQPSEDRPVIEQAVSSALLEAGCTVRADSQAADENSLAIDVRPLGIGVSYGEAFREGLFGTRRTARKVSCDLAFEVTECSTKTIRLSRTLTAAMTDTVDVAEIQHLENPASRSTHGTMPDDSLLDRVAEPLVIIGAAGVIIYLFFHIRS